MDLVQTLQEKYLQEFGSNIPLAEFLLNMFITAALSLVLRWFYIRYGSSISNRARFGKNFLPLALGTLLIITIVKSSIALSLGLVGALSIVRFRAAIKEPEELTYLFITIGIGLAGGANQPILATVSVFVILLLLYIHHHISGRAGLQQGDKLFLNLHTDVDDLPGITAILTGIFPFVELKRMDSQGDSLDLTFACKADKLEQIQEAKAKLRALSSQTRLSIVEQPEAFL
jgi:hypothetical protein